MVLGKLRLSEPSTEANSLVAGSVLGPLPCARSTGRHFFEIWPCSFKSGVQYWKVEESPDLEEGELSDSC